MRSSFLMKIFLDTADTDIISKYFSTGLVDGVTTNPTLIMKSGKNPEDVYQTIKDDWCQRHQYGGRRI